MPSTSPRHMDTELKTDNAYVSGMKEDLKLGGNDLSHLQSALLIGNYIGQVPGAYFFPKLPLRILIPTLDLGWGIFNLLQYRATELPELMAYRFLICLFEWPARFLLLYWTCVGTLTASLLQAATTKNLDGVNDLAGWRWNLIITGVYTLPLALIGWFIFPGTPDKPNRFSITKMSKSGLWFAFNTIYFANAISPVLYGRDDLDTVARSGPSFGGTLHSKRRTANQLRSFEPIHKLQERISYIGSQELVYMNWKAEDEDGLKVLQSNTGWEFVDMEDCQFCSWADSEDGERDFLVRTAILLARLKEYNDLPREREANVVRPMARL
ncbi:hypothetical protein BDZ45DRAFT_736627 [Acephala macrosclerotiorum]|nr:hypothetical protein BDZ45DRAFT_736627 [Acephala macrosclerotiorum]